MISASFHAIVITGPFIPRMHATFRAVAALGFHHPSFPGFAPGAKEQMWLSVLQDIGCIGRAGSAEPSADIEVRDRFVNKCHQVSSAAR